MVTSALPDPSADAPLAVVLPPLLLVVVWVPVSD
jgi:hypothetical protein